MLPNGRPDFRKVGSWRSGAKIKKGGKRKEKKRTTSNGVGERSVKAPSRGLLTRCPFGRQLAGNPNSSFTFAEMARAHPSALSGSGPMPSWASSRHTVGSYITVGDGS